MRHNRWVLSIVLGLGSLYGPAFAATDSVWAEQAQVVCQKLELAQQAYAKKDMQQAHLHALMAYFQAYDQKIEPAIRRTMGQARVFQTEQAFNKFNASLVENPTPQQLETIAQQARSLCDTVTTDARSLDEQHINPQLYQVES